MFYLGMIHLEGRFVSRDAPLAFQYFIEGAARNNAYCFFELSRLYADEEQIMT